jgi:hypothetical protein
MSDNLTRLQPAAASSAEGASACGTFDTITAPRKATLTPAPVASEMPKIAD